MDEEASPFVSRTDAVIVVIDMQERLIPVMTQREKIVDNTKRLLALARTLHLPVVVTEQEKLGPTVDEIAQAVIPFDPVAKVCFNCFLCEAFDRRIGELGRKSLILAGIEAHICVAQTALWAHPRFTVHVVADAVSSRAPENVSIAIERIRGRGITVTSTEMLIYELLEKAGTEEFRAMLPFVK